jgi:hypothetical protein
VLHHEYKEMALFFESQNVYAFKPYANLERSAACELTYTILNYLLQSNVEINSTYHESTTS